MAKQKKTAKKETVSEKNATLLGIMGLVALIVVIFGIYAFFAISTLIGVILVVLGIGLYVVFVIVEKRLKML